MVGFATIKQPLYDHSSILFGLFSQEFSFLLSMAFLFLNKKTLDFNDFFIFLNIYLTFYHNSDNLGISFAQ